MRLSALRWPVLLALYLASRLAGLMALPMFLDERIHLRWAWWIAQGRRLRVPILAGRGLSVYLLSVITPRAEDPLRAGRLVTVAVGMITLAASYHLARRLFRDGRTAGLGALLYIACPFTLLYDRMVLTDAFLAAFTALSLLLSVAVVEKPRLVTGAGLGLVLALGVLSKTSGLVLFVFPLTAWLILGRERWRALAPLATAYAIAALIVSYPLWLFFRKTDELAGAVGLRDGESAFAGNTGTNVGLAASWLWAYWTPGLLLLAVAGLTFALATRREWREAMLLALLAAGPVAAFVAVSEIWYPRYLLFTAVPLLPLAAHGLIAIVDAARTRLALGRVATAALALLLLTASLFPALRFDIALWRDPAQAPFPALDRFQLVTGWPSGYGTRDTVEFLRAERARSPHGLLLVTPGPSTTASAARLLWSHDPGLEVRAIAPETFDDPAGLSALAGERALLVIVSLGESVRLPSRWSAGLEPAFASYKPDGSAADEVYRPCLRSPCRP